MGEIPRHSGHGNAVSRNPGVKRGYYKSDVNSPQNNAATEGRLESGGAWFL